MADAPATRPAPRPPNLWAATVFIGYLLVQLLLPLYELCADGDGKFSWRMFAISRSRRANPPPRVEIVSRQGEARFLTDAELRRYILRPHSLRYSDRLPAHFCRVLPEAAAVRLVWPQTSRTVPCAPG